jgi:Na+-driven multidrug efflux pump
VLLGAPHILRIFGQDYAAEGSTLLRLLALAAIPNIVNALYLSIARVRQRLKMIVLIQGSLCALMLGLGYVLLTLDGITGLGIAAVVSQTAVAVVLVLTQLRPSSWKDTLRSLRSDPVKQPDAPLQP